MVNSYTARCSAQGGARGPQPHTYTPWRGRAAALRHRLRRAFAAPRALNASYMGGIGCGGPLHFYPTPGVRCAALHNASQRIQRCYTSQRPAKHSKGVHSSALQPRRTKRAQRPAPPSTCCAPSLCLCLPTGTTPLWQCGSGALQLQCAVRCARERLLHTWHVVGLSHATTTSTAVAHRGWLCRAACTL